MGILRYFLRLFTLRFYITIVNGTQRFNPFLSLFILCLLWVINPTITLYTDGYVFAQGFEAQVSTLIDRMYPDDLEVRIQNGIVSTSVQEPYYVTVSPETFKGTFLESKNRTSDYKQRLLAIDTHGRAEDFERYQASALLTDRSLVYYNDNKIRIQPLRESENMLITKKIVQEGFQRITDKTHIGQWLRIGVIVLPFLLVIGLYIVKWIALLWYALLVWGLMKIFIPGARFGQSIIYTAAVSFIPGVFSTLIPLIPNLPSYMSIVLSLMPLAVLTLAYLGVYYATHEQKLEVQS